MSLESVYNLLPKDVYGPRSKNRFRNEMFWGIKKIYELYNNDEDDFFVIFDCACDIEVGKNNKISFFQLKTKDDGTNFTLNALTSKGKKEEHSILSKLYSLNLTEDIKDLYIVSNARLKCENNDLTDNNIICFNDLNADEKLLIMKKTCDILGTELIEMSKIKFIRSEFCITNPDVLLLGETVNFLNSKVGRSIMEPNYFLDYLKSMIYNKSCYEQNCNTLDEALINKGLKREDVTQLISTYKKTYSHLSKDIYNLIDKLDGTISFMQIIRVKKTLKYFQKLGFDKPLIKETIERIITHFNNNSKEFESLITNEVILNLIEKDLFDTSTQEYEERICLVVIALTTLGESI